MDVKYISPQLEPLVIRVDDIKLDDQNARKHPDRNLKSLKNSLRQFTQRKPIVVQRRENGDLICRAGNGTLMATRALRREYIAAVVIEENDQNAKAFAIADNRTSELSEWDDFQLAENINNLLEESAVDLDSLGYNDKEFEKMMAKINGGVSEISGSKKGATAPDLMLVVTLDTEEEQEELFDRLQEEGYQCKVV